ncbi:interleukin-17 receptor E [Thalassophryne amazonica]|uniref:interleukin-17 receptor E n=1 Tax=Thalassophryne amazonica TaxID=390379 RepID=UPI00147097FE|nr:interleukin-17 receptor E [Thalassophryne amazonica]
MRATTRNQNGLIAWELIYDCVTAEAHSTVYVVYSTTLTSCNVSYTVSEPTPDFHLSVSRTSKSVSVFVESEDKVYTKLCYQKSTGRCIGTSTFTPVTIDPSQSRSAVLNIPYWLPCVCVQVYYTHTDARRDTRCPFQNDNIVDVADVWLSSRIELYPSNLKWISECPASTLNVSAALCWRQNEQLCININSTLQQTENKHVTMYNTSAVDKHPQMCVQFSLQGSHHITCPFHSDMSSWAVHIEKGRQGVSVCLSSSVTANFSAQLCFLTERECTPKGPVHSVKVEANTAETWINVPIRFPDQKPCVQVWQSDPALQGHRILCPDYTHQRCGMYIVAALLFAIIVALLGISIHGITSIQSAGWIYIQKPVLLVCSSERSTHVSAVCALASILQGELRARVSLSLWAQNSQKSGMTGSGSGLADVGPLPWLYGQWEAVCEAQGKMLLIWSPEARRSYVKWREDVKWREERAKTGKTERKKETDNRKKVRLEEVWKASGERLEKCKKEGAAGKHNAAHMCDGKEFDPRNAHSSVIAPVFTAALACLEGVLQGCKGQRVAFVYFEGLGHSKDIPKAFRGVPRYCLPQDLKGLIQELAEPRQQTQTGKPGQHCWPRLFSKIFSIWLARRLAHKLQTMLPEASGKKTPKRNFTSSQEMMSERTGSRLKLPSAAKASTVREQEPLCRSPYREGEL